MRSTWALVPVKSPARSKSRLRPVLDSSECSRLCMAMLRDVLEALRGAASIEGIAVVTGDQDVIEFATAAGHEVLPDNEDDLCCALDNAAAHLAQRGVTSALIIPADVPTVSADDIDRLMERHQSGLSISPAIRDGGTNALICSPPNAIQFCYGKDSARRHLQKAQDARMECTRLPAPAFFRDIDLPDDLAWLNNQSRGRHALAYLRDSGIGARLQPAALEKAV
jgi:2-phospho-L-lactate guanylyltransferase